MLKVPTCIIAQCSSYAPDTQVDDGGAKTTDTLQDSVIIIMLPN
jgi:hypothetical protein